MVHSNRDLVHRQTACAAIQHMSLGVYGFGCEDALTHLLNYVWPNIFETSPHLVQAFMGAIEGLKVSLGPIKLLQYTLQVIIVILQTFNFNFNNFLLFRVSSILPEKYEMSIGRFTTLYILEDRTHLFRVIPEF